MATIHLIDASPYLFRAWFSLPEMFSPKGRPVSAVYGWAGFLVRYLREEDPSHVAAFFDESLTTSFRNDIYPAYKSSRPEPPAELVEQLRTCKELSEALGVRAFADATYEADDLIATLAHSLVRRGHGAVVVTSDKDLAQLVGPDVEFYDFARGTRLDSDAVQDRWGVPPAAIPDFLGLAGDAVDDIPGVRGVGPKTATALLAAFGDLDGLYENLERVPELPIRGARTLPAKLESGRDLAFLSRDLATLALDAPAQASVRELAWKGADPERVAPLFRRLGFDGIRRRIPKWNGEPCDPQPS